MSPKYCQFLNIFSFLGTVSLVEAVLILTGKLRIKMRSSMVVNGRKWNWCLLKAIC